MLWHSVASKWASSLPCFGSTRAGRRSHGTASLGIDRSEFETFVQFLGKSTSERSTMRILIAEDERISRLLLATAVKRFGHDCLLAEDGAQAWQLYQTHAVDVIISDREMPHMD